jgi:uncharacterized membrane-anchored protein YhcB (DUF1043 family)
MSRRIELVFIVAGGLAAFLVLRELIPSWQVSKELRVQGERLDAFKGDLEQNKAASARHAGELAAHGKKLAEHDAAIARGVEVDAATRAEVKRLGETTARDLKELQELHKKAQRDSELLLEEVLELKRARRELESRMDAIEKGLRTPRVNPKELE